LVGATNREALVVDDRGGEQSGVDHLEKVVVFEIARNFTELHGRLALFLKSLTQVLHMFCRENTFNPRFVIKPKDGKGAFFHITNSREQRPYPPIRCLDLKTLIWALQNQSHSLESACSSCGVEGKLPDHTPTGKVCLEEIEYNRQDVRATVALLNALRIEFDRHPIDLAPDKAYSPASIAKAYLKAMGVIEPFKKFGLSPHHLGVAMQSYYGGRAEVRIRHTPVPLVYTDFLSQYPTVNTLMELWKLLIENSDGYCRLGRFLRTGQDVRCFI
jgi:hypothetical protein